MLIIILFIIKINLLGKLIMTTSPISNSPRQFISPRPIDYSKSLSILTPDPANSSPIQRSIHLLTPDSPRAAPVNHIYTSTELHRLLRSENFSAVCQDLAKNNPLLGSRLMEYCAEKIYLKEVRTCMEAGLRGNIIPHLIKNREYEFLAQYYQYDSESRSVRDIMELIPSPRKPYVNLLFQRANHAEFTKDSPLSQLINKYQSSTSLYEMRDLRAQILDLDPSREYLFQECMEREKKAQALLDNPSPSDRQTIRDALDICTDPTKIFAIRAANPHQSKQISNEKTLFHFLLDRTFLSQDTLQSKTHFTHGHVYEFAEPLALALENERNPSLTRPIENLRQAAAWDYKISHQANQTVTNEILTKLEESLLIPLGFKGHSASIFIEINPDQTYRLTLYNTGSGIENHPQLKDRYQTFLTYDNIPSEDLSHPEAWNSLLQIKSFGTCEDFYKTIADICKNGTLLAPSTQLTDYKRPQLHATCAAQNLVAYLRHQVSDSSLENLLSYKVIKMHIRTWMTENFISNNEMLNQILRIKNMRIHQQLEMRASLLPIDELKGLLKLIGKDELANLIHASSHFELYHLNRMTQKIIAYKWLEDPKLHESMKSQLPKLSYAKSIFDDKTRSLESIFSSFDSLIKEEKWDEFSTMLSQLKQSSFYNYILVWCDKYLSKNPSVSLERILKSNYLL